MRRAIAIALLLSAAPAAARDVIPGPVPADIVAVKDGDTITVRAHVWPQTVMETVIRLRGINTPEMRGKCEREKTLARAAMRAITDLAGSHVTLLEIEPDKFGGRFDAHVVTADGANLAQRLIALGHGRPYDGGPRGSWCP